ncbi:MAG: alpha/beta fold hydrolase [Acidimicrobiales bacterium]
MVERCTSGSGARIRYLDNSPAEPVGLPVLFVPGLSDFADEYVGMLGFFHPRRVLVVEVRGRGRSEAPPTGYTVVDHMHDLRAVLEQERISRFHLMTFSRGTSWALELALDDPSRVETLSIGDYQAIEKRLTTAFVESLMQTSFRGRPMAERMEHHVLERLAAESTDRDLWDRLGELTCPLLLARGGADAGVVTDEVVERYRTARPDVEVVVVPDAPHDLFRPDRLFYPRAVADFITRRSVL